MSKFKFALKILAFVILLSKSQDVFAIKLPLKTPEECAAMYQTLHEISRSHIIPDPAVNLNNDWEFLTERSRLDSLGRIKSNYSEKYQTRFYQSVTGAPDAMGNIPKVDPESKGVYIFIHGSGTKKAGGRNFVDKMNNLVAAGYSAVGFDLPFHSEGPRNEAFNNADYFMEWMRKIVNEYRVPGKPVYLAGHSFGPDVIAEFITRFPNEVDGVVMVSPAGFTKTLRRWYEEFTSKMKFGGDVPANIEGGIWSDTIIKQFIWNKKPYRYPNKKNPNLKIRILTGDMEEYVPARVGGPNKTPISKNTLNICKILEKFFPPPNGTCTVERGVGHYIFGFNDVNGDNAVMRELALLDNKTPTELAQIVKERGKINTTSRAQLAHRYETDTLFKAWADKYFVGKGVEKYGPHGNKEVQQAILDQEDYAATAIIKFYNEGMQRRAQSILENLRNQFAEQVKVRAGADGILWPEDLYSEIERRLQVVDYLEQLKIRSGATGVRWPEDAFLKAESNFKGMKKQENDIWGKLVGHYYRVLQEGGPALRAKLGIREEDLRPR